MFGGWKLIKQTVDEWQQDEAARMGASLAYYALFSGTAAGYRHFHHWFRVQRRHCRSHPDTSAIARRPGAAKTLALAIHNAGSLGHGIIATIASLEVLSLGATRRFQRAAFAMNKIWKVRRRQYGFILGVLKDKFASFTMVLSIAFLLLISMIVRAMLSAVTAYFSYLLPSTDFLWHSRSLVVRLEQRSPQHV